MKNRIAWMSYSARRAFAWLLRSELGAWQREPLRGARVLEDFVAAALSTGTKKKIWVMDQPGEIVGIRINADASTETGGTDTIDIMVNGVTIWTTNAKASKAGAAALVGDYTVLPPDAGKATFKAGDTIRWDCTAIGTGGTTTGTSIAIATVRR